ncbi:LOW QUALITY PROTEIN: hypothetical protein KUTeg_008538 [Tegillarca granosa]|uniref:Uncharacterized protein n=1 Tax=Tegillarca granosa TaxID=220873 RepID=A0ABQ9FDP5_TEGGR|nr:LOW QUALITY PROTEIN: hypothetical protein KUTeg_008538 [Tegillarca granosa]
MAAPQSIDDLLVCLMSMGFDWSDCQDAVQYGKNTSKFDEGLNPFSQPTNLTSSSDQLATNNDATQISDQSKVESNLDDNQSESGILSRLHLSNEQRQIKQHFEKKQRDEAKHEAMKEKQRRKRDHDRILKEIAEDREKQKQIHGAAAPQNVTESPVKPSTETSKSPVKEETKQKTTSDNCLLRIRMLDGSSKRTSLPATSCFIDVWNFLQIPQNSDHCLIETDTQKISASASNLPFGTGSNQNPGGMPPIVPGMPPNMAGLPAGFGQGFGAGLGGGPGHLPGLNPNVSDDAENTEWGPGHRMDTSDNSPDENMDHSGNEDDINDEEDDDMGQGFPGAPGGGNNMDEDNPTFWGVGQRLVPEGVPHDNNGHHSRSARELAAEKATERYSRPAEPMKVEDNASTSITYNVDHLLQLCMSHVAQRLNDPRHLLRSLSGISEDLAQKLLQHLLRQKLLKQKTLNAFIPCFLRKLIVIHTQPMSFYIQSVLKKLKNLNLSGCKQLTDKCLQIVQELPSIVSLNLEETGITEEGLILYLASCPQCLQHLNLSRTKVTEKIFSHLKNLPALKSLYLEQTQVCGLSGIQELRHLETLDVSHTDIVTDSLLCLRENKCLTCFSISHTEKAINLPSRHTTTDTGMKYLAGFPLTVLDLTNFRNVGNIGMQYIGQIKALKRLLLINTGLKQLEVLYLDKTNITDEGASILKEFTHLQELSLASTQVTSVKSLELRSLTLLNLECTAVKPYVLEMLYTNCPKLKNIVASNLIPVDATNDDEGMEI